MERRAGNERDTMATMTLAPLEVRILALFGARFLYREEIVEQLRGEACWDEVDATLRGLTEREMLTGTGTMYTITGMGTAAYLHAVRS